MGKRKNIFYKILFFLIIIIIIAYINMVNIAENKYTNNLLEQTSSNTENNIKDLSHTIYEKNDLLMKISNYEYSEIMDRITIYVYIENNSTKDLVFTIDGDISINGYMVEGGYFYQEVNANTKCNTSFIIRNLKKNIAIQEKILNMKFKLDIYHSENYWIDERIEDNLEINYDFF